MAHGFLTPQSVSGDRFWQNAKWMKDRLDELLRRKKKDESEKGGALATTQKGDIYDPSVKAVRVTDVSANKSQKSKSVPPAALMLKQSTKGGAITNIPGVAAAPKKLNSEVFFKAAQTGVDPETGRYLTSEERKEYLKKSKSKMNATASVASASSGGITSSSSLITKGDEAVVGSVGNLTNVVSSLVDAVKAQTAAQKQISAKETAKADTLASRAKASAEERALSGGADNSGFITPSGGVDLAKLGGGALQGGMGAGGGPGFGVGGKVAANAIAKRGVGRMAGRAGARIAGKQGAQLGGKVAGKLGLKAAGIAGKKIPLLGLGLGGIFAIQRAMRGDWAGAGMELASGAASTVPGLGTAASLGIDAALLAKDAAAGMAGGGLITGGKKSVVDDVPIRADEGEVVMSNAAGNTFGRSTLLAMNAMGGGSNKPTGGKGYAEGGLVGGDASKSKKMFRMFGEGMIDAQKQNSRDFAKIQSAGLRQYYENEGGGERLGKSLANIWGKIGGVLGSLFSGTLTSLLGGSAQASPFGNPADYLAGDTSSLASFIGGVESGNDYTKLVGGKTDANILNKTVSQLNEEKGGQFAMGRYQIQMRTAIGALKNAGIDPSKFKFDQAGQDKLFQLLLEGRGYKDFMSGKISKEQFATNLSMEWAALPKDASGRSYYAGVGNNKAHRGWGDTLQQLDTLRSSGNPMGPSGAVGSTGSSALASAAVALKGKSTKDGPDGGKNGCVYAVNKVYKQAGITPPWGSSLYVPDAESKMQGAGYQQVSYASRRPGDVMVMYDRKSPPQAHIGVVLGNGNVLSNSSGKASFSWEASPEEYNRYYGGQGKIYRMPGGTSASTVANNRGNASPSRTPSQPLSVNGKPRSKADLVGSGGQGGRGSGARASRPAPAAAPANQNTGTGMMASSAQYSMATMGLTSPGGGTTVNNIYNTGGQQGSPIANGMTPGTGSGGMGLTWMALVTRK
jgi:hypothetical protein